MLYALADFGSTFTKVALVESSSGRLLATAQHRTTIESDVIEGWRQALREALADCDAGAPDRALAASSAGGGLRMVAVGLVDDLTAAAARRTALSAGARVGAVFAGALGSREAAAIRAERADVILFAGGTDGGDRVRVLANARAVAQARSGAAIVVACNADAAREAARAFVETGHETVTVANVLPEVHREAPEEARAAIRDLFIERVVQAKGMSAAAEFFQSIVMPSPAAVLAGAELMADGSGAREGLGTVALIDVGGATTDVHSIVRTAPAAGVVMHASPPAARASRTVEGDLGVRWNADAVLAADRPWLEQHLGLPGHELEAAIARRKADPRLVPGNELELRIDRALASSCMHVALARHVGRISTRYVPGEGAEVVLDGRDLRETRALVITGGSLVRRPLEALEATTAALGRLDPGCPAPRAARVLVDERYVLAAAGLLASEDPEAALALLHAEIPGLTGLAPTRSMTP